LKKYPRLSVVGFVKMLKKARESGEISFKREGVLFFETNNPGEAFAGAVGHAGGVAASLAAKGNVRACDVNFNELHRILKNQSAYLEI
jgi:hypothetical protein